MNNKENGRTGELAALAENVYDKIYDLEELKKVLGPKALLFRKLYREVSDGKLKLEFDENGVLKEGELKGEGEANISGVGRIKWIEDWYDDEGILNTRADGDITKDWVRGQFLDYINIFNEQLKDSKIIKEVRERIRQSLMERALDKLRDANTGEFDQSKPLYQKLEKVLGKKFAGEDLRREIIKEMINFTYEDASHAEELAYTQARFLGVNELGDDTYTGFAAGTKLFRTKEYRTNQGDKSRAGESLGNPKTIGIYKMMGVALKDAIRTLDRSTPQEVINEIVDAFNSGGNGKQIAARLRFANNSMRTYGGNLFGRAFAGYQSLSGGEEIDLDKIVSFDVFKGVTIDRKAMLEEINGKLIKPERYRTGFPDLDYNKEIALSEVIGNTTVDGHSFRIKRAKTEKLGKAMFGDQVFQREFLDPNGNPDLEKLMSNKRELWREAMAVRLAADIASHRDSKDMSHYWTLQKLQAFYLALGKMPANVSVDEKDFLKTKTSDYVFDKQLIEHMKKISKTEDWRTFGRDIIFAILAGIIGGSGAGVKKFAEASVKT